MKDSGCLLTLVEEANLGEPFKVEGEVRGCGVPIVSGEEDSGEYERRFAAMEARIRDIEVSTARTREEVRYRLLVGKLSQRAAGSKGAVYPSGQEEDASCKGPVSTPFSAYDIRKEPKSFEER